MSTRIRTAITAAVVLGMLGLVPALPAVAVDPASISGTVTSTDSGLGIPNVRVRLFGEENFYSVTTDALGAYTLGDIADDDYLILFDTSIATSGSYVPEYWNSQLLESDATTVPLVNGDVETFDASLATGGRITGTVTGNEGAGSFNVIAYRQNPGNPAVFDQFTNVLVPGGGAYTLRGLPAGNYHVTFGDNSSVSRYGLEAWADEHYPDGDVVTVTGTATTTGIDAELTVPGPVEVSRLAGVDRFATSAAVWDDYPAGIGGTVYIASGRNFPDALGAGPAAAQTDSPLMLVDTTAVPSSVLAQLNRLDPDDIVVVGGLGTISQAVEDQLDTIAPVHRIAGVDRYDTSRQLVRYAFTVDGSAPVAFIATGANFPDALSAGPAAGTAPNTPVILVPGSGPGLDAATLDLLDDLGTTTAYVVGSEASVSAGIAGALSGAGITVMRKSGVDRYATSTVLNLDFFANYPRAYLATGAGFPDALAGAARAAAEGNPLFVIPPTCIPMADMIDMSQNTADEVTLLGGPGTLNDRVESLYRC